MLSISANGGLQLIRNSVEKISHLALHTSVVHGKNDTMTAMKSTAFQQSFVTTTRWFNSTKKRQHEQNAIITYAMQST
jgi:hypothetical protein